MIKDMDKDIEELVAEFTKDLSAEDTMILASQLKIAVDHREFLKDHQKRI